MVRLAQQRSEAPSRPAPSAREPGTRPVPAIQALQRTAGNRAVARLLSTATVLQRQPAPPKPKPVIAVHPGSTLGAAEFVRLLKGNKHVPSWLKSKLVAQRAGIALKSDVTIPAGETTQHFVDDFNEAFNAGDWVLTTGTGTIDVTDDAGTQKWTQRVVPDLQGARPGHWMGSGPAADGTFISQDIFMVEKGVQYGQTLETQTSRSRDQTKLIVVVTAITVTRPDKRTETFKVDDDLIAESVIHEVSVHAGEMAQGRPGLHGGAWIEGLSDEIAALFRPVDAQGTPQPSALTKRISAFAAGSKPPAPKTPARP